MPFCTNCGYQVDATARFCPNCGQQLAMTAANTAPAVVQPAYVEDTRRDYRVVLVARGTCARAIAIDMISDLLGYTDLDAARIVDNVPMEVALGLTAVQAQYISQAMAEYGMDVSVFNGNGYVDMVERATGSVFGTDGLFLNQVTAVLAGLGLANRVTSFNRWTQPAPNVFRPRYRQAVPPTSYRRRTPYPTPVAPVAPVRPVAPVAPARPVPPVRPQPVQPVRPAPTPAPARPVQPAPAPSARPVSPVRPQGGPAAPNGRNIPGSGRNNSGGRNGGPR